jgi:alanine-glyoxylate transaminase / serine-glyoxylate transaminase / serine-pyruvate transaminase
MLPPGLGFNAVSRKARAAAERARLPRSYWDWAPILAANQNGFFPYTPPTNLLYGLDAALDRLLDEGLPQVFARHARHAETTRRAAAAWGLSLQCIEPAEFSNSLTGVVMPDGHDADRFRAIALDRFDLSLGAGLGKLGGTMFRIGHLGDLNDLMLLGALAGVEAGLQVAGVPINPGGVTAAIGYLVDNPLPPG